MAAPYNFLQFLRFSYSGREIGIDKFKPYTSANEKASLDFSLRGGQLSTIRETGAKFVANITSGEQIGVLADKASIRNPFTGSQNFVPKDENKKSLLITGSIDSALNDRTFISNPITSGTFDAANIDNNYFSASLAASFIAEQKEICPISVGVNNFTFKSNRHDVDDMDFVFFTGYYSEGHFSINVPIFAQDSSEIDFIFFTGSFQG